MSEPVKFCKDCRWFVQKWWGDDRCSNLAALKHGGSTFLINGDPYFMAKCVDVRFEYSACGREGKLWEAKGDRE